MKFVLLVPLSCLLLLENVFAAPFVGSDHHLQFMQKMQGSWLRDCRKAVHDGKVFYEQTRLAVSYTHLNFKTGEYKDNNCTYVINEYKTRYAYTLGGLAIQVKGKRVYEIDIDINALEPGVIKMYPQNIVQFDNGYLYFGQRKVTMQSKPEAKKERLSSLDRQTPFYRR